MIRKLMKEPKRKELKEKKKKQELRKKYVVGDDHFALHLLILKSFFILFGFDLICFFFLGPHYLRNKFAKPVLFLFWFLFSVEY